MSVASPLGSRVLADVIARPSTRVRAVALDAALVLTGTLVVALLAQVEVPLWPVPITGQTLAVIVVGAALGARRGALSLLSYLVLGVAGLPLFAGLSGGVASIAAPSFGFVIGFVFSAFVAGWFAERTWDRRPALAFLGFVAASVVPFLIGVPYMAFILNGVMGLGYGVGDILAVGVLPFILGGIVKAALAAGIVPAAWALVRRLDRTR